MTKNEKVKENGYELKNNNVEMMERKQKAAFKANTSISGTGKFSRTTKMMHENE